jgi:hypothetical protein
MSSYGHMRLIRAGPKGPKAPGVHAAISRCCQRCVRWSNELDTRGRSQSPKLETVLNCRSVATMKLTAPKDHLSTMDGRTDDIVDEDIEDAVGNIKYEKGVGRHVELYGGRYKGTFQTYEECQAFVQGVQAVLEHMIG